MVTFPPESSITPVPIVKVPTPLSLVSAVAVKLPDKLTSEKTDEDIAGTGLGLTLNIPKKENKHPGFSFSVAYAVPMFGSLRQPNPSPDSTWGMVYLSGMTNY